MTIIEGTILGIVQGLTEFSPISSSGHLVLGQAILGIEQPGNEFEILVHLGTLASILVVFFNDIKSLLSSMGSRRTQAFILFLLIGTLPTVIIGLGFRDIFETLFENVTAVGAALLFTGTVLVGSSYSTQRTNNHSLLTSVLIGCAQAIAIIPGISRSGMTISCALFIGLSPKEAARFSFLLAIPAISGAGLLMALDMDGSYPYPGSMAIAGLISSFIVGVAALKWLLGWLEEGKFHYFGIYCLCIGLITLVI